VKGSQTKGKRETDEEWKGDRPKQRGKKIEITQERERKEEN
jgi:hypothetical protein